VLAPTSNMRVRFTASDLNGGSVVEAGVDGVQIRIVDCEIDCNMNGISDVDDISGGTSRDCNSNGIPDECDFGSFSELYCYCDANAPCGNNDATAGCSNSTGAGAVIGVCSGTNSIAADDLVLTTTGLPANQFSITFMGQSQIAPVTMGDGRRCVGGTLYRYPIRPTGSGTKSEGPGLISFANSTFPAAGQIMVGQTWNFQDWYRDPVGSCGSTYSVSNAVGVTFGP